MGLLNWCRLYLQVLTLSDIVAANGHFILQHAKDGVKDNTRVSRLRWPNQGKPTANDWATWRSTLSALESYGHLKSPLGKWVNVPHQEWVQFMDGQSGLVYMIQAGSVQCYRPLLLNTRTRAGPQCWIDTLTGQETLLIPEDLVPATFHQSQITGSLASVVYSSSPLPGPAPVLGQSSRNTFFKDEIEGLQLPLEEICKAAMSGKLVVSISTTGWKTSSDITGQWAFHSHMDICSGQRPYPQDSKYRAELYSLHTAIHILLRACTIKQESLPLPNPHPITISVSQKRILTQV